MRVSTISKIIEEVALVRAAAGVRASRVEIRPNKIVFCAYHGAGYGCNPKYICETLIARAKLPLDLVWLTRKHDPSIPPNVRQVRYGSSEAFQELASAKVWVDNSRTRRYIKKKPGQFYLQTWHGCLSPKRLEADIASHLSQLYIHGAKQDSAQADLMVCNNDFFEGVMRRAFWYNGPIVRCGLPRNAPLIRQDSALGARVRQSLGVPEGVGLCLYAPTFRDDGSTDAFQFDYVRICAALQQRFGKPLVCALRLHPNLARNNSFACAENVIDVSDYSDPIELLCAADVCISDYSSMAEDFALLARPGFLFMPDARAFSNSRAGLYYPHDVRPFPSAFTEEELIARIAHTTDEEFSIRREAFFDMVGFNDDGYGAEVLAELLEQVVAGVAPDSLIGGLCQYNNQSTTQ